MFYLLVVLVRMSVPVQVIDWKDLSPKWHIIYVDGDIKPYSLTHSRTSIITITYLLQLKALFINKLNTPQDQQW